VSRRRLSKWEALGPNGKTIPRRDGRDAEISAEKAISLHKAEPYATRRPPFKTAIITAATCSAMLKRPSTMA
jgi:hypothetical protein